MPYPGETYVTQFTGTLQIVAQELRQFYALLLGWLSVQHKEDGSHSAITGDSLAVTGAISGSAGTFAGDVVSNNATGLECGIGSLATVNGTTFEAGEPSRRKGLLLGGVTNGVWIEQRDFASPFTGSTSELRLWLLPWDAATAMLRIGIISSVPTLMDGGTGSTAMNIGTATRPIATVTANTYAGGETGTWTPVLSFGGASVGITYSTQSGTYSKFGNIVLVEMRIVLTSKGSSVGAAGITGLPFTALGFPASIIDTATGMAGLTGATFGVLSSTTIFPVQQAATTRNQLTDANFTNTTDIRMGIAYRT